jgi:pimeloyl-ACP methyl ester carboxylesterase
MGCGTGAAAPTPSATPTPSTAPTPSASSEDYTEIAITVAGNPDLPLSGLLTLPAGAQKPPVVILVQGSGATDMDETIGSAGNKPFRDIAQGLAEVGIASIRYDKRYFAYPQYGQSLGSDVTVEDEVLEDVSAAIALAQADERVDGSRVYVLGHSMGGMLVPKIADMHPELAGLISVAGSLRQLWDIIYDQNMELVETLRPTLSEADSKTLDAQLDVLEDNMAVLNGDLDAVPNDTTLLGIPAGYWKSLKASNGMRYLDACSMPMLIMQGDADFQVYPQIDYQLWVDTMGDWDNVTCRLYEGLNHLMMPTAGLRSVEEYNTAAQVDPQVISDISAFVLGE